MNRCIKPRHPRGARSRGIGFPACPSVRPRKQRGRNGRPASLEQRIEDLASLKSEFKGDLRKSAGFLDALFEIIDLMGPDFPTTSPGPAAAPLR